MSEEKPETTEPDASKLVIENQDGSQESTPIHDEVRATTSSKETVETADSVKADVKRALERETQDGKGDEDPGPSDFLGFATEGVEKEEG